MMKSDEGLAEALVSATDPMHRFLMKKQMEYELKNINELWKEFEEEAFRKTKELSD